MEIVLMRHGEPEFSAQQGSARVKATDMSGWIAGYDASGVTGEPDCHAVLEDKRRAFVISSPLPRARASASCALRVSRAGSAIIEPI